MNIAYIISSHIGSYETTLPILREDFLLNDIDLSDVFFFVGGFNLVEQSNHMGINLIKVDHNSFDMTAIISMIEIGNSEYTHWFLLHDTIRIGPNFKNKLFEFNGDSAKFTCDGMSMNMAILSYDFVKKNKDLFLKYKNKNYDFESLQNVKKRLISEEDKIFSTINRCLNKSKRIIIGDSIDYYKSGVNRIVEYYPDIDVTKIKSNWHVKEKYELNL